MFAADEQAVLRMQMVEKTKTATEGKRVSQLCCNTKAQVE